LGDSVFVYIFKVISVHYCSYALKIIIMFSLQASSSHRGTMVQGVISRFLKAYTNKKFLETKDYRTNKDTLNFEEKFKHKAHSPIGRANLFTVKFSKQR
jgi:hypothetical protein